MTVQQMNRAVVRAAVNHLLDLGYRLSVWDGGEWAVQRSLLTKPVVDAVLSVDESVLRVWNDGEPLGRILFVLGNDGPDAIADHSLSLEEVLQPVFEYCDKLEERYCG